jgi:hypothetical protein
MFLAYSYVRCDKAGHELTTLSEHTSSTPVFSGVRVIQSLVLYVCFVDVVCPFIPCCLVFFDTRILITPFGIFKLFLYYHFVFFFVTMLVVRSLLPDILYGSWYLFGFSLIFVRKGSCLLGLTCHRR